VNQAYQEAGNMAKVLPEYLSEWTTEKGLVLYIFEELQ